MKTNMHAICKGFLQRLLYHGVSTQGCFEETQHTQKSSRKSFASRSVSRPELSLLSQ